VLGGTPLRDTELLAWVEDLITAIMPAQQKPTDKETL